MLVVRTVADDPVLGAVADDLVERAWPQYIRRAASPRVGSAGWSGLCDTWPELQLVLFDDDEPVACGHTVPLHWTRDLSELPDDGWDWVMNRGYADVDRPWNTLCAIAVSIPPEFRGRGLSSQMLAAIRVAARGRRVIVPVRPSEKSKVPRVPIDEYLTWRRADGLAEDAWLRVHERLGGRVLHSCPRAMTMTGSVADWARWTGVSMPVAGEVEVPELLAPLQVRGGVGTYVEPNVWVVHEPDDPKLRHQTTVGG